MEVKLLGQWTYIFMFPVLFGILPSRKFQQFFVFISKDESDSFVVQSLSCIQLFCDCSPPVSSVHGISQPRILECYWHQLSFSGGKMQCLSQMPSKESKQLVLKMPELPKAFRKQFLKTGWVRGVVGCCDQLMAIPLIGWWWGNQESTSLTF